ncbi:MAG TPA: aminoglycoside phosphotransferase family protein [Thermomicrobiales bacterium]|nr:aminoglycoside phosphotransferase family protein [Thermomicrobiales bacterium]
MSPVDWLIDREGDAARTWVASLPALIERMCNRWDLTVAGPPIGGGTFAIVIPVVGGGVRAALKCVWPGTPVQEEVEALQAWNRRGTVRLLRSDPLANVLLLEWLDPERSLSSLPAMEAAPIAGRLIRTLAIEAPPGVPRMADRVEQAITAMLLWSDASERPFPQALPDALPDALLSRAIDAGQRYGPRSAPLLVNWDLHHGNILAGEREPRLVIDPMTVAGDPELSIWPMLLRRVDEMPNPGALRTFFDRVVEAGGLDPERAGAWTLFRAVDYWLWSLDHGLTEDPVRCATIIDWLAL